LRELFKQLLRTERGLDLTQRPFCVGYDALQLACALAANDVLTVAGLPALTFVSADESLLAAAITEGIQVENPDC